MFFPVAVGWFLFLTPLCLGERAPAGRFAEQVAEHPVPQFGFKPRTFWRQDAALVGDGYQVGDAEGMHGKGDAVSCFVRQLFQFFGSSNAADEGDAPAFSRIFDGQQGLQHLALEDCGVKRGGGIFC